MSKYIVLPVVCYIQRLVFSNIFFGVGKNTENIHIDDVSKCHECFDICREKDKEKSGKKSPSRRQASR